MTLVVPYAPLDRQWAAERIEAIPLIDSILATGDWVSPSRSKVLESQLADICQSMHAVCLNSGTDALVMGLLACGVKPGDEVITVPNSFVASTAAIVHIGAVPVFVDVLEDQTINADEVHNAITSRTRAILPVHLTGRMCDMEKLSGISVDSGLPIVEDAAQAIGSKFDGIPSGSWGTVGCFSLHPLKNLNAIGDAGFIVSDDDSIADRVQALRSHGLVDRENVEEFGFVSRMDVIQATVVSLRLRHLNQTILRRRELAAMYWDGLDGLPIVVPPSDHRRFDTFHTFVIQTPDRQELRAYLQSQGIQTRIHYPKLIPDQPAMTRRDHRVVGELNVARRQASEILSLPINQHLTDSEISTVIKSVRRFYGR